MKKLLLPLIVALSVLAGCSMTTDVVDVTEIGDDGSYYALVNTSTTALFFFDLNTKTAVVRCTKGAQCLELEVEAEAGM